MDEHFQTQNICVISCISNQLACLVAKFKESTKEGRKFFSIINSQIQQKRSFWLKQVSIVEQHEA
jgi:hypothetical protein